MKTKIGIIICALLGATFAHGDPAAAAKRRAREIVNQNNVRQGVGEPGAPAPQAPPVQPGRPQPADPITKLKADIAAITSSASVTEDMKKQFATDLSACARGSRKPSPAAVGKFAGSLSAALAGKEMEARVQSRLAQDINIAFNSASLSAQRATELTDDVQAILQTAGVVRANAVTVSGELKAITAELQASK